MDEKIKTYIENCYKSAATSLDIAKMYYRVGHMHLRAGDRDEAERLLKGCIQAVEHTQHIVGKAKRFTQSTTFGILSMVAASVGQGAEEELRIIGVSARVAENVGADNLTPVH